MGRFARVLPPGLVRFIRLIIARVTHRGVGIYSGFVSRRAELGRGAGIGHDTRVDADVSVGKYTYIMRYCEITNADIGNYCSIANNVAIGAAEHPYTRLSTSPQLYRSVIKCGDGNGDARGKTVVGSDVWIGNNAVIKAGVRVGHGAVIGAGSVVTHDVPPYAIAVGSPAKIIKYRFDGATIERLLGMSWWEWSEEEIIRNRDLFTSDPLN